ncbi:MAG TPA: dihydroorotase [Thermohalobaculum sp.]|nr:dihydroorotase [Thermohalobaculum sp.]
MTVFADALLIDPEAGTAAPGWLRVEDGLIAERGEGPAPAGPDRVDCAGLPLAPGIVDMRVFVGDPGARHREGYRSAGAAAAAGGVTTIISQPDTSPPLDDPALLQYALERARANCRVNVRAMGALTRGLEGREMTEQQFLLDAGAVALTDADRAVEDTRLLRAIMSYATSTGALIVHHCQEPGLSHGACATSGEFASRLALPSVPAIAERMGLERDLALVEATGCRYHAAQLSTEAALAPLSRARAAGLDVTAAVSIHHLTLNEFDVADYRTFFKLCPPLRPEGDRTAMVEALAEGLIDIVVSSHLPQDEEAKRLPFEEAATGAVGLETFLPAMLRLHHSGQLTLPQLFRAASLEPARRLGLPSGRLGPGAPADLVLFDPDRPFVLDRWRLCSRSKNTPFDRTRMEGKVLGTWVAGTRVYDEDDDA